MSAIFISPIPSKIDSYFYGMVMLTVLLAEIRKNDHRHHSSNKARNGLELGLFVGIYKLGVPQKLGLVSGSVSVSGGFLCCCGSGGGVVVAYLQ